ncbi:MAG: UDP-3-O-[3-hydroxymyristoyl] glucosamine N-acyltransferase [Lentimonas sp.]|jgi:UDP-3-O-[3-hydroxymyristoyl] glucosamine N-acyltransferase
MSFIYTTERILEILGGDAECIGQFSGEVVGISSLKEAREGDLSFLGNLKYRADVAATQASVLLLPQDYAAAPVPGQLQIKVSNPSLALALICRDIEMSLLPSPQPGIHPSSVIEPGAVVSPLASIGAFCHVHEGAKIGAAILGSHVSIGRYAKIADGAYLFPRVVVADYCEIGLRNRIQAGAVIGSDGYGYEFYQGAHQRVPQVGNVVTAADVDIGANSTIDRARFGSTQIGAGTKIDNMVQIAHNVRIGQHCLIVAQVGISGSTRLGDGVIVGGQAGLAGHLEIGSGAMIAGGTAVTSSLAPKSKVRGYPAEPMMLFNRIAVLQRKLPELFKRFDQLEKKVESLDSASSSG